MSTHSDQLFSTIAACFARTVARNRAKPAIRCGERLVTFGEFGAMTAAVSTRIRALMGSKKQIVAVIAERSVEAYAAIYGIVCSGNAYLPVSPALPRERIEYMLADSGAALVLHHGTAVHTAGKIPCLDIGSLTANAEDAAPVCHAQAEDAAYVIYTSGSTGAPKGAVISNASVVNRIQWMHRQYPLDDTDMILQKTPFSFDVSVWEIFWWGMFGGCMDILPEGDHYYPARILDRISRARVTHIHFVPSMFDLFIRYLEDHPGAAHQLSGLKHIFLSGETLSAGSVNRFSRFNSGGHIALHNLYGPTECTVDVTYYDCALTECDPIPIGRPIDNTAIYILDNYGNLLPPGVKGELYIGGVNVGQGYLNNPGLTTRRFIENPFGPGRLYKTGDLAMWREDGQVIYCGRCDSQIKLNGQRIELEEIEQTLLGVPGISNAAVVLQKKEGRSYLAAFYSGRCADPGQLRNALSEKLPAHMIPSLFCHLEALPLNGSGKIARSKLREMKHGEDKTVLPQSPLEQELCDIFRQVLRLDTVGRNTNFLHAGGTSLDIMTAIATAKCLDGISVAEFIAHPTPAALANFLREPRKKAFRVLQPLRIPKNAANNLVLFPFAGGDAASFTGLVAALETVQPDTAVYCADWACAAQLDALNRDVCEIHREGPVYFYAHCAGTGLALALAAMHLPDGIFIGGNTPPGMVPGGIARLLNPWSLVPNSILRQLLRRAGLPDLADVDEKQLFAGFRRDTAVYFSVMRSLPVPLDIPCTVFVSDRDPFTPHFQTAGKQWAGYFTREPDAVVLTGAGHYFHQSAPAVLAQLLTEHIPT